MGNQYVAFMDERHGLGSWVAEQIAGDLFRNPEASKGPAFSAAPNGGAGAKTMSARPVTSADLSMSLLASGTSRRYSGNAPAAAAPAGASEARSHYKTWTSPRATAQSTAAAVVAGEAQVGVLPLYEEGIGFNRDTLSALIDFPQTVLGEYVAESNYVLAVPTDLIHEVDQAGFTDSFDSSGGRSFQWTAEKQRKYRNRVGIVYATADAMRHCAPAIEGMRAKGIDVQLLPDGTDAYREGLSRAAQWLDPNRQVETSYSSAGQQRVSRTSAANRSKPLVGVLLSFDKALGDGNYSFDSDYQVMDTEMAGADRVRTSFIATTGVKAESAKLAAGPGADKALMQQIFRGGPKASVAAPEGLLRQTPGLSHHAGPHATEAGGYPYARLLYAVPTVGPKAKDHAPVLAALAAHGFSHRVTTIDDREGMPAVIAIDVPRGGEAGLKPVLGAIYRLPGARRLAAFPSVNPMVAEDQRPRGSFSPKKRKLMMGAGIILAGLAAFVVSQL